MGALVRDGVLSEQVRAVDCLVNYLAAVHPEFGDPFDVHVDRDDRTHVHASVPCDGGAAFEALLERACEIHSGFSETGYLVEHRASYAVLTGKNGDGDLTTGPCAVIHDDKGQAVMFVSPDAPIVFALVEGRVERPAPDQIRVLGYLIRLFGQFVGLPGFTIAILRHLVAGFRELVRLAGVSDSDDAGDAEGGSEHGGEGRNDAPYIRHTTQSTTLAPSTPPSTIIQRAESPSVDGSALAVGGESE